LSRVFHPDLLTAGRTRLGDLKATGVWGPPSPQNCGYAIQAPHR